MSLPPCLLVCVFLFALLQERRHTHNNSAVRADFLERRWAPLVAPPAPALARQGGGPGADPNSASPLGDRRFNDVFVPLPKKPLFHSGRGTLPLPPRAFQDELERPRWPKMAPRGPPMLQDGLQDGSRQPKMVQDSFRHASKRPQEGHKTVPSALGDPSGPLQEPNILQKPQNNS